MGIRIVIEECEHLSKALRRLKKLLSQEGIRYAEYRHQHRLKPCEERRRRRGNAKIKACRAAYLRRRELGLQ